MGDKKLDIFGVDNPFDWKNAPTWANFKAQDFDGKWWWFNREPRPGSKSWLIKGVFSQLIAQGYANIFWRGTLEARPE